MILPGVWHVYTVFDDYDINREKRPDYKKGVTILRLVCQGKRYLAMDRYHRKASQISTFFNTVILAEKIVLSMVLNFEYRFLNTNIIYLFI